jgi:hypothetical protein
MTFSELFGGANLISVKLENCNNVISGEITLIQDTLNIRYAMNGTGKSTLAKALKLSATSGDLSTLKTFGESVGPTCQVVPPFANVLVFDEEFVSNIVFRESEVIQNAFEVFIKTPEYEERQRLINERLKEMHIDTASNQEYGKLLQTGQAVLGKFTKTSDNKLKKTGLIKSLTSSESIFQLPEKIKKFQPLMDKEYNVDWVGWKHEGNKYDDNEICPFCTTVFSQSYPEEKKIFIDSYTKSNVKNVREMFSFFESLTEYMDPEKREIMFRYVRETADEETVTLWVTRFYSDLEFLVGKIKKVIDFNSYDVKQSQVSGLAEQLAALTIDASPLEIFNSAKTIALIDELNTRIQKVASVVEKLKQDIGTLKGLIGSSVTKAVKDINDFLEMAAIDYELEIRHKSASETSTVLKYKCRGKESVNVEDIKLHLSWGERNAFALVLFMHYARSQGADLVILDDPVSSFDTNKKYAIINRLFLNDPKRESLYKKTVLMLTHDFQPVIDFVVNSKPTGGSTHAAFLRNDVGRISQTEITTADIRSFTQLLSENAQRTDLNRVHRITSLRKLIEHSPKSPNHEMAYNLLSCLLHGKPTPTFRDESPIPLSEIQDGEIYIKGYIADFSYSTYIADVFTKLEIVKLYLAETNDYFRLQVFRVLVELYELRSKIDDPLLKYIDEQFHINNDYVFYLDLTKFNVVPSFVLPKCDDFLKREKVL